MDSTLRVFIGERFLDSVPVISSYVLMNLPDFPPTEDRFADTLNEISTCVGEAMECECIQCKSDVSECGTLVTLSIDVDEYSIECDAMCADCLNDLDTEVLDIESLQDLTKALLKTKLM